MSARQIGAFRRHRGMNVGYTLKGFLHCGAYACVSVSCPLPQPLVVVVDQTLA